MRAQIIEQFGGVDVFKGTELPKPQPGPGRVAVRQAASSVNPVDYKIRLGEAGPIAPTLPAVIGSDISGRVIALGEGVTASDRGVARWSVTCESSRRSGSTMSR